MGLVTDLSLLHPRARRDFEALAKRASNGLNVSATLVVKFGVFETYRSPVEQQKALARGASKAGPYQSAHQFGLAADFVPIVARKWTWNPPGGSATWDALDRAVAEFPNLRRPIEWDRPHVEHILWDHVRHVMK